MKSLDNVAFSGKRMVSTSGLPTRHLALMVIEMMVTIPLQLPWSSETERACCSGGDWRWNWALPHIIRSSVGKPIGLLSSPGGDDDHNDSIAEQEWWQWGIFKGHCCCKKDLIVILCFPKMIRGWWWCFQWQCYPTIFMTVICLHHHQLYHLEGHVLEDLDE